MPSWGDVFGWIFDRLPTRKESILNEIKKIEDKRSELQKRWMQEGGSAAEFDLYNKLGKRLQSLEERLKTFKA